MLSTFLPWLAWLTNKSALADLDKLVIGDSQTNMWNNKQIGFAQLRALMGGNITSVNGFTGTVVLGLDDLTGIPTPLDPWTVLVWTGTGFEWTVAPTGGSTGIPLAIWRQDSTGDTTITGAVNGVNVTYELTNTPVSENSVILMYNGLVLERGVTDDYTITGKIITFNTAPVSGKVSATYVTQSGTFNGETLSPSELLWTDGDGGVISLPVATYPSLIELTYFKWVTSGVQAQITSKQSRAKQVVTTTDDSTAVINVDITDVYQLSAIANATVFTLTGSPTDWQMLVVRIKDAGVSKALTWTGFTAIWVTLPTVTVVNKWHYIGCQYNLAAAAWHVIAVSVQD